MNKKKSQVKYRLRDEKGRFVTKAFNDAIVRALAAQKGVQSFEGEGKKKRTKSIDKVRKEAKIDQREVFVFYKTNEDTFLDMLHNGSLKGMAKNSNQLERDLSNYKGKIILNGKETTANEAILQLMKFKQALSTSINVVDFTIKPTIYFDGKMQINIPDSEDITEGLVSYFGARDIEEVNEDYTGAEITDAMTELLISGSLGEYDEEDIVIYAS